MMNNVIGTKQLKNNSGMTLVEIISAIFVLGILIIGFSSMFTNSLTGIFDSGGRSERVFEAQNLMENALAVPDQELAQADYTTRELSITFAGDTDKTIQVSGKEIDITLTYQYNRKERELTVTSFH